MSKDRISKWEKDAEQPRVDGIRAVCAALGVPAGAAMVEAGLLRPEDIGGTVVNRLDPATLTKRQLLEQLDRRLPEDLPEDEASRTVTPLRPILRPDTLGEEWAARQRRPQK